MAIGKHGRELAIHAGLVRVAASTSARATLFLVVLHPLCLPAFAVNLSDSSSILSYVYHSLVGAHDIFANSTVHNHSMSPNFNV